jgi:hypothetical protein
MSFDSESLTWGEGVTWVLSFARSEVTWGSRLELRVAVSTGCGRKRLGGGEVAEAMVSAGPGPYRTNDLLRSETRTA